MDDQIGQCLREREIRLGQRTRTSGGRGCRAPTASAQTRIGMACAERYARRRGDGGGERRPALELLATRNRHAPR